MQILVVMPIIIFFVMAGVIFVADKLKDKKLRALFHNPFHRKRNTK